MRACCHIIRSICCCLLLILLAGCQTAANKGPIYKLQSPDERALSAPVAVSITDKRPANEQNYRAGAVTPMEYQQGIEILSLDNFEPQIAELLKQACAQQLSTLASVPSWADIEVTRFRVVIDRREILAAEYERQLQAEEVAPVVGLGAGMIQGDVQGMVGGLGAGLIAAARAENKRQEIETQRAAWQHSEPGVTCEIELHVQLHWEGGRRETFDVQARSHSISPDGSFPDSMNDIKWNVSPMVETAIAQASIKMHQQAESCVGSAHQ